MEKAARSREHKQFLIPFSVIIWPWIFLILWAPILNLAWGLPIMWLEDLTGISLDKPLSDWILRGMLGPGIEFFYYMLIAGVLLNLGNAVFLFRKGRFKSAQSAMLVLRITCIFTYPVLIFWGLPFAVFYLLGPKENEHIFLLMGLSLPALNLSGAFYAVPLVLRLRKEGKINVLATMVYLVFSFVVGLDIVISLLIRKELEL